MAECLAEWKVVNLVGSKVEKLVELKAVNLADSKVESLVVLSVDLRVGLWAGNSAALLVERTAGNLAFLVAG